MSTIDTVVLKVAAPCNLNCMYCYEYRNDTSWRSMPKRVAPEVVTAFCARMRDHAHANGLKHLFVNAHGGEPMLLGADGLDELFRQLRDELEGHVSLHLGMQTNATLTTPAIAAVLRTHQVSVGISIDGPRLANIYRVGHDDGESFDRIIAGLAILRSEGVLTAGALAVINRAVPAIDVISFLAELGFANIDLLQPMASHEVSPLPNPDGPSLGDWWSEGFLAWTSSSQLRGVRVRFFEDAIKSVLQGRSFTSEFFGRPPRGYIVVRTDGSYEGHDYNKINGADGRILGLNVREHGMDEVLVHPALQALNWVDGSNAVPTDCTSCPIASWCKGGSLPTRFSAAQGYDNRSVYCADLQRFFTTVGLWLLAQSSLEVGSRAEVSRCLDALASWSATGIPISHRFSGHLA
jgi:uncharacterized protein